MVLSGLSSRDVRPLALQDRQMRLWDLRTNVCQGLLQAPARPCAAFDQQVSPWDSSPEALLLPPTAEGAHSYIRCDALRCCLPYRAHPPQASCKLPPIAV